MSKDLLTRHSVVNPFQKKYITNQEEFKECLRKYDKGFIFETFEQFHKIVRARSFQINYLKPNMPQIFTSQTNKREVIKKLKDVCYTKYHKLKIENILTPNKNISLVKPSTADPPNRRSRLLTNNNKRQQLDTDNSIYEQEVTSIRQKLVRSADPQKRRLFSSKNNKDNDDVVKNQNDIKPKEKSLQALNINIQDDQLSNMNNDLKNIKNNESNKLFRNNHRLNSAQQKQIRLTRSTIDNTEKEKSTNGSNSNLLDSTPINENKPQTLEDAFKINNKESKVKESNDDLSIQQQAATQIFNTESIFEDNSNNNIKVTDIQMNEQRPFYKTLIGARYTELYKLFKNPDIRRNKFNKTFNYSDIIYGHFNNSNKEAKNFHSITESKLEESTSPNKNNPLRKYIRCKRDNNLIRGARSTNSKQKIIEELSLDDLRKDFQTKIKEKTKKNMSFNPKKIDGKIERFYERMTRAYDNLERRVNYSNPKLYD